jgi:hypothetical protein
VESVKNGVLRDSWSVVLGWLEFVLKHSFCPDDLAASVDGVMRYSRLAYGVFDGVVISVRRETGKE